MNTEFAESFTNVIGFSYVFVLCFVFTFALYWAQAVEKKEKKREKCVVGVQPNLNRT